MVGVRGDWRVASYLEEEYQSMQVWNRQRTMVCLATVGGQWIPKKTIECATGRLNFEEDNLLKSLGFKRIKGGSKRVVFKICAKV